MSHTNKTQATKVNPEEFLKKNYKGKENVQAEARVLIDCYTEATGSPCVMWNKIFGFGKYSYQDSKGGEHTFLLTGFAISLTGFTLYSMVDAEKYKNEIEKLGKYKLSGKSCIAIKNIEDIDLKVLKKIIKIACIEKKKRYKTEK